MKFLDLEFGGNLGRVFEIWLGSIPWTNKTFTPLCLVKIRLRECDCKAGGVMLDPVGASSITFQYL